MQFVVPKKSYIQDGRRGSFLQLDVIYTLYSHR